MGMEFHHLNILGASKTALRIVSVWDRWIELADDAGDDGDLIKLHDLAATDRVATDKWVARLLALGILSYEHGADQRALAIAQQEAAKIAGVTPRKRKEVEGESSEETTNEEIDGA